MKVLYIHMIGAFGGASRSLSESIAAFPTGAVEPHFVTAQGSVEGFFGELGPVVTTPGMTQFDNTRYSYYRGLRWVVALRELRYLPGTISAVRSALKKWPDIDLIHVNEFTGLVPWLLARRWFKVPVVVHVRSVARNDRRSVRTRLVSAMLRRKADAVIAIDETVRESLPPDLPVSVVHNSFSPSKVAAGTPALQPPAGLRPNSFKIGFVGNLLKVKGIHELVAAAALLVERGVDVEFIIVGDNAAPATGLKSRIQRFMGLEQNVKAAMLAEIERLNLTDRFHMLGFTARIAEAYAFMDVLCFPSHFDAPGRPIFEAALVGVPAIAAIRNPKADTLVQGVTGLAVPPKDAGALADAIETLAQDRVRTRAMGEAAQAMATDNFNPAKNAQKILKIYRALVPEKSGA